MTTQELKNKKITLTTLKSFAKKFENDLYANEESSFDGMTDMVENNKDAQFKKTTVNLDKKGYYQTGIQGIYTVGSSRDMFTFFENESFFGIEVYNCCGCSILATKK